MYDIRPPKKLDNLRFINQHLKDATCFLLQLQNKGTRIFEPDAFDNNLDSMCSNSSGSIHAAHKHTKYNSLVFYTFIPPNIAIPD
jgi:hypothetical protein